MTISLEGQIAVVTGGSRGIGRATVKLLAQAGANVVFSYRSRVRAARALETDCLSFTGRVVGVRADAAKTRDARRLIQATLRRFGRLDTLVANAGIWNAQPVPIERLTEKQWDEMMAVNLKGVYAVVREAVPSMIRSKRGRIVIVSSTAGQRGEAYHTHYGASKGALISFVKGLSTELAPHHILVNCIAPGWVDTEMCAPVLADLREARKAVATIPMGRFAKPEEIAMPILFLASEMASYMTGETVNVNGGSVLCG